MKKCHYTYIITDTLTNKMYIGVRSSDIEPINDIGVLYFSSSSNQEFIKEQHINPNRFRYDVIKIFDNRTDALENEIALHKIYDVGNNPMFYNLQSQNSSGIDFTGKTHTESAKLKIGNASRIRGISQKAKENLLWQSKNRVRTDDEKNKISNSLQGNNNALGKRSDETRQNISNAKKGMTSVFKGKKHSKESKEKMSIAKIGDNNPKYWKDKKRSDETKLKISNAKKGQNIGKAPIIKCPHCEKEGGLYAMKQWHFDNCKFK
jgi:hypothetical protein